MIKDTTNLNLPFPLPVAKFNFLKKLHKLELFVNSLLLITVTYVGFILSSFPGASPWK